MAFLVTINALLSPLLAITEEASKRCSSRTSSFQHASLFTTLVIPKWTVIPWQFQKLLINW